jgi:hypothetical protein
MPIAIGAETSSRHWRWTASRPLGQIFARSVLSRAPRGGAVANT